MNEEEKTTVIHEVTQPIEGYRKQRQKTEEILQ